MNLSENLKRIRKENNLSQEQLADKLGVSRQSVSKWETGDAYPEMDKVLQLCKMFNLNVDELLNQNINEVKEQKQSKNMVNKYINEFLSFVTKTVDMFTNMKFKQKIKCLFEQIFIGLFIAIILVIIGYILFECTYGIIYSFPQRIAYIIHNVLEGIYGLMSLIFGLILLVHIFKIRYLDYYALVKEKDEQKSDLEKEESKKEEKIIIRDPKHSEYRFITGILKCIIFIIKFFVTCFALGFCLSLICFAICLVLSFLIIKSGLLFLGILLMILSSIVINIVILYILYNFIVNKQSKKRLIFISFIISLICFGVGFGLSIISLTNFNVQKDYKEKTILNTKMQDNFIIISDNGIHREFIDNGKNDITIVIEHNGIHKYSLENHINDETNVLNIIQSHDEMKQIKRFIKDINDKKYVDYNYYKVKIYTSKENIEKLKQYLDDQNY